jgi:hypothetical protein
VHSRAVGPVQSVWQAPRAFVRMHRRPNDHLRLALPDDVRQGRIGYVLIDTYLLCASLAFFIGYARRSRACALPNPDTEPSMAKG